jgi:hypothetical protein
LPIFKGMKPGTTLNQNPPQPTPLAQRPTFLPKWAYITVTLVSFSAVIYFVNLLLHQDSSLADHTYFFLLVIFGLCTAFMFFGITEVIAEMTGNVLGFAIKAGGPFAAFTIVIVLGIFNHSLNVKSYPLDVQFATLTESTDIPRSIPNGLTLKSTASLPSVHLNIDPDGEVTTTLMEGYFQDSVFFEFRSGNEVLAEPGKKYKLDHSKKLMLMVTHKPVKMSFSFVDNGTDTLLPGIQFKSVQLSINAFSGPKGDISLLIDTSGIPTFRFSISSGHYEYRGVQHELLTSQLTYLFPLEHRN